MNEPEEVKEMTLSELTDFINERKDDVLINVDFGEYRADERQA